MGRPRKNNIEVPTKIDDNDCEDCLMPITKPELEEIVTVEVERGFRLIENGRIQNQGDRFQVSRKRARDFGASVRVLKPEELVEEPAKRREDYLRMMMRS